MKLVKRLGKILVALIAVLFLGVLVCALQPSLTEKLSSLVAAHYGQEEDASVDVDADSNTGEILETVDSSAEETIESTEGSAEGNTEAVGDIQTAETEVVIKPMEWDEEKKNMPYLETEETASSDGIISTMDQYNQDCLEQMIAVGTGEQQFTNEVPEELWTSIEKAYSDGSYRTGYVNEALQKLGVQNFAIQLQTERLGNGKYRIYHNISTW